MTRWRTAPMPPGWPAIRAAVLARDGYRCTSTLHGERCTETDRLEVHHTSGPNDHRPEALRTLCHWHHKAVTASQGGARSARRPRRPHPGDALN